MLWQPGRMPEQPINGRRLPHPARLPADPPSPGIPVRCDSPVFILTASRSGSTLLRVILDSHPRLACPPETEISSACMQLAMTCDVLENAAAALPDGDSQELPPAVRSAVREAVDRAYGYYLAQRGKQRWCDKSLDSFLHAELMAQLYPDARFICLFRHCMDVIASGVEACPWGLQRYGFDPFVAQYPGNSVAAVGSYWLSCAQAILSFCDDHPGSCHQIRYEDLVTAPEKTVAAILSFLGEQQVPGITRACFDTPHEANGPADEKLWFTSAVTAGSMGRGTIVPASALPEPVRGPVNQMLGRLGYRPVDEHWNDSVSGTDPRLSRSAAPAPRPGLDGVSIREIEATAALITARLRSQPSRRLREIADSWPAVAGKTIGIVIEDEGGGRTELQQAFPLASAHDAAACTPDQGADGAEGEAVAATITAGAATWRSLLTGSSNVVTELSAGRLRSVGSSDDHGHRGCIQGHHPTDALRAVAALLGISKIPVARTPVATAVPGRTAG
jgi:hypothetical protein